MRRYKIIGSFGLVRKDRVRLLQSNATQSFVVDYRSGGKKIVRSLEVTDQTEALKIVEDLRKQLREHKDASGLKRRRSGEVLLYIIQRGPGGPIKVGITTNLVGRLKSLQTANAEPLLVLETIRMRDIETALHGHLERHSRLIGEWFPIETFDFIQEWLGVPFDVLLKRYNEKRQPEVSSHA